MTGVLPADSPANGAYTLELGLYDGVHGVGTTFFPPDDIPQPFYRATITLEPAAP